MTSRKYRTLILDGRTVRGLLDMKEAVDAVERAFKCLGEGKVQMPPKAYINPKNAAGDFRAMPACMEGYRWCGIKWVNVHPSNLKKGLPTVMGVMVLSDPDTGYPVSVMDATYITALRTGAAGGVAAKYLARKDSSVIALVGCGTQAETQLLALLGSFRIKTVKVWGLEKNGAGDFAERIRKKKGINIKAVKSVKECVSGSDIVVTTTPSRKPIVRSEWLKKGAHINAIGADAAGKEELDPAILRKARVIVDSLAQAAHSGEINVPLSRGTISLKDIYADIGEIIAGKKKARTRDDQITVFDSTGLAIQDVAVANVIYDKAKRLKKGRYLDLIN